MSIDTNLLIFLSSVLIVALFPGPDVVYIIHQSTTKGFRCGGVAVFGVMLGLLFHLSLAVLGITTLIVQFETPFLLFKCFGISYLLYLAWKCFTSTQASLDFKENIHGKNNLLRAFLVNALNPKVALFFIAVLPQFVELDDNYIPNLILLGVLFIIIGSFVNLAYCFGSSRFYGQVSHNPKFIGNINLAGGLFFLALSLYLIITL